MVPNAVFGHGRRGDVLTHKNMPDGATAHDVVLHGEGVGESEAVHPDGGPHGRPQVPAGDGDVRDAGPRGGEISGEVALEADPSAGVKIAGFSLQ